MNFHSSKCPLPIKVVLTTLSNLATNLPSSSSSSAGAPSYRQQQERHHVVVSSRRWIFTAANVLCQSKLFSQLSLIWQLTNLLIHQQEDHHVVVSSESSIMSSSTAGAPSCNRQQQKRFFMWPALCLVGVSRICSFVKNTIGALQEWDTGVSRIFFWIKSPSPRSWWNDIRI